MCIRDRINSVAKAYIHDDNFGSFGSELNMWTVSYTHLDVYKRQPVHILYCLYKIKMYIENGTYMLSVSDN